MFKTLGLSLIVGLLVFSHSVLGQISTIGQQRILQSIIINGQQVQGVMVVQDGAVQTYTCLSPEQYVTADQSSSGWACYDQTTGVWLLHAQPPSQTAPPPTAYQQPPTYVPAPSVQVYSYSPPAYYSYGYYPPYPYYYPYYDPFFVGPGFGFGFGFGFRSPLFVNRPVVINRPVVVNRPFGINGPVGPVVASRPSGGFRSGGGRAFARAARR